VLTAAPLPSLPSSSIHTENSARLNVFRAHKSVLHGALSLFAKEHKSLLSTQDKRTPRKNMERWESEGQNNAGGGGIFLSFNSVPRTGLT
jgi:hypothetical protein